MKKLYTVFLLCSLILSTAPAFAFAQGGVDFLGCDNPFSLEFLKTQSRLLKYLMAHSVRMTYSPI